MGFFKPIREGSVAVLIGLGIFLIFLALYVLRIMSQGGMVSTASFHNSQGFAASFFTGFDKRSFLYGVGVVAVIIGTLAYFGVYGVRLNSS